MASRTRAIKLFAVVVLAGACDSGRPAQPAAQPAAQAPAAATRVPRTLPSGRPATGNVVDRGIRRDKYLR